LFTIEKDSITFATLPGGQKQGEELFLTIFFNFFFFFLEFLVFSPQ